MDSSWDTIIVGAGIAGACAAIYCARRSPTLVIEAEAPAAGASGAAAGLVNPFMGRRARPVWRRAEALDALSETLALGNAGEFFSRTGVLRIPRTAPQADTYRDRHDEHPEETEWLSSGTVDERYPDLRAPHGALIICRGGFVQVSRAVARLLETAKERGARRLMPARVTSCGSDARGPYVVVDRHTRLYARQIILAVGAGYEHFSQLRPLGLRGVKGQTVTVRRPPDLGSFPAVSGFGYTVPDADRLVLGSTYEHEYTDDEPHSEQTRAIIDKVSNMIPRLARSEVIDQRAGIRVMTPQTNKAMIGPLPGRDDIWFFGGLGSKGLLMAPMLARRLPQWLDRPAEIPARLRPDSTRTTQ